VGASFPVLQLMQQQYVQQHKNNVTTSSIHPLSTIPLPTFNSAQLQKYILFCCQPPHTGGLVDKPGKSPDYYHTCYCLSGLSVAQNNTQSSVASQSQHRELLSNEADRLHTTNVFYNVTIEAAEAGLNYYYSQ
jgi:protein farnesyltransferase subunit beta